MLKIEEAILINKYGQSLINFDLIVNNFSALGVTEKRNYLKEIIALIIQSKPKEEDIAPAIVESKLRPTVTPILLLRKGIANHNLQKIAELPEYELEKVLRLMLSLFKLCYKRRFQEEKNNPNKWWYWDLSDHEKVKMIIEKINH